MGSLEHHTFASSDHIVSLAIKIKGLAIAYEEALAGSNTSEVGLSPRAIQEYAEACDELNRVTQIRNIMTESERVLVDAGAKPATGRATFYSEPFLTENV